MKVITSKLLVLLLNLLPLTSSTPLSSTDHHSIRSASKHASNVPNITVLVGNTNTTLVPLDSTTSITTTTLNSGALLKTIISPSYHFIGATLTVPSPTRYYGVWEYPFASLLSNNASALLTGVGNAPGVNWSNARTPFFISSSPAFGIYIPTLSMGSFNFTSPTTSSFVFNTSSLIIYTILPDEKEGEEGKYKSILKTYMGLSEKIEMPSDEAFGPTFWSDDFEQDFHGNVTNAQENIWDVAVHLTENRIRATGMFDDRPYGTGNNSFGNFDFDPKFYPSAVEFIANLSTAGYTFAAWVANRAFLNTELYNVSSANNWLFTNVNPEFFLGPALNLSIPAAYDYFKGRLATFIDTYGLTGFKIDRGEEGEMPFYEQNIQGTLFENLCHEVMLEKWGPSNFYNFARSVYDGSRSKTGVWNGDAKADWQGLQYSVLSGLRSGIMGFSLWGSDTGGYNRGVGAPTEELWARWMWVGALSPVYEIMVGLGHTPWYANYTEELVGVLKKSADLHLLLLPYIRSYTWQASQDGVSVIRPLWLEYGGEGERNRDIWEMGDEYLFGGELLVAPVVESGGVREVYFPGNTTWVNWFEVVNATSSPQVFESGTNANVSVALDEVPLYVKEGAIVPTGDIIQGNYHWDDANSTWHPVLNLEIFPSWNKRESKFTYWSRESNRSVEIKTVLNGDKGNGRAEVVITYGDFGESDMVAKGVVGTIKVHVKGKILKKVIEWDGGQVGVEVDYTLWD